MKKVSKDNLGITLVALVITIIVMVLLAGITINMIFEENGILFQTKSAKEIHEKERIKEDIEMIIADIRIAKTKEGKVLTKDDIFYEMSEKSTIIYREGDIINGEYEGFNYIINEKDEVIIGERVKGVLTTATIEIIEEGEELIKVKLLVIANSTAGDIQSIEPINGATLIETTSNASKIFEVTTNGVYNFLVTGTNGRSVIIRKKVENFPQVVEYIFDGISKTEESGIKRFTVNGKNNAEEENITYLLNIIHTKNDIIFDGKSTVLGFEPVDNTYSLGSENDCKVETGKNQNTVVLKVDGNLTIDANVKLTSVSNDLGYGGPKGLIIYCTGKLVNNGEVSMTARGSRANGENVYLLKNEDGTYEYIPANDGNGGASTIPGGAGGNGSITMTEI